MRTNFAPDHHIAPRARRESREALCQSAQASVRDAKSPASATKACKSRSKFGARLSPLPWRLAARAAPTAPRGRLWIRGTPRRTHAAAHAAALPCKPGAMCAQFHELSDETQRAVRQRMCVSAVCSWSLLLGAIYLGYALLFGRGLGSSGGGTQVGRRLNAGTPGRLSTAHARALRRLLCVPLHGLRPRLDEYRMCCVLCLWRRARARQRGVSPSPSVSHCIALGYRAAAFANAQRGACGGGFGRHPGLVSGTLAR